MQLQQTGALDAYAIRDSLIQDSASGYIGLESIERPEHQEEDQDPFKKEVDISRLAESGLSVKRIAELFGVSPQEIITAIGSLPESENGAAESSFGDFEDDGQLTDQVNPVGSQVEKEVELKDDPADKAGAKQDDRLAQDEKLFENIQYTTGKESDGWYVYALDDDSKLVKIHGPVSNSKKARNHIRNLTE